MKKLLIGVVLLMLLQGCMLWHSHEGCRGDCGGNQAKQTQ